jgi:Ni/Co efflux regulator RcnB
MSKLLIALLFSAFAMTSFAADTDKQTDGAELGTNETPQAKDQTQNSRDTTTGKPAKRSGHVNKKAKHNHQKAGSAEENPLQPSDAEPAPGAATH